MKGKNFKTRKPTLVLVTPEAIESQLNKSDDEDEEPDASDGAEMSELTRRTEVLTDTEPEGEQDKISENQQIEIPENQDRSHEVIESPHASESEDEVVRLFTPYVSTPGSAKQNTAGRKQSLVWNEFITEKIGNKIIKNNCKHCDTHISGQPCRMEIHLKKCKAYQKLNKPSSNKRGPEHIAEENDSCPEAFGPAVAVNGKRRKTQSDMRSFVVSTAGSEKNKIDKLLGKFIYENNLSFNCVDSNNFKNFVNHLNPSYKPPSAVVIGGRILDEAYEESFEEIKKKLSDKMVAIAQDGWSTCQSLPVIAHSLICDGKVYLLNAVETGSNTKSAAYCTELLAEAINTAQEKFNCKVVGAITDNCSTMISLHGLLREKYGNLYVHGCNSHLFNLIGDKFTSKAIIEKVVTVQKYFKNHQYASSELKRLSGKRPMLPANTGWNSQIDTLNNYADNSALYIKIFRNAIKNQKTNLKERERKEIMEILMSTDVDEGISEMIRFLDPISQALDKCQRNTSNVADAVSCWVNVRDKIPEKYAEDAYFLSKMKQGMIVSSLAAYILHPVYRGRNLSNEEKESGRNWLAKIHPQILTIAVKLSAGNTDYFPASMLNESVLNDLTPIEWWKDVKTEKIPEILIKLVEELFTLPASTAFIERSFSVLGDIISKKRNRLSIEKAEKLCFIYVKARN